MAGVLTILRNSGGSSVPRSTALMPALRSVARRYHFAAHDAVARLRAVAAAAKSHSRLSGVDAQLVGYSDLRTPMRKARRLILI